VDEATVQHFWHLACADAEFADDQVVFLPYTRDPGGAVPGASFHPPGVLPSAELSELLDSHAAEQMDWELARCRITCCVSIDDRLIAPVLRHELEHARQWQRGGGNPTFELVGLTERILNRAGYAGLPASGQIYTVSPHERDANGAASRFIRRLIGDDEADLFAGERGLDPGLFRRRPEPEPPDTLARRLICHAAAWPDTAESAYQLDQDLPKMLDRALPGGSDLWRRMRDDSTLRMLVEEVGRTFPTKNSLDGIARPEKAWQSHKRAVIAAYEYAMGLAASPQGEGSQRLLGPARPSSL
jgi:hypothetical protein